MHDMKREGSPHSISTFKKKRFLSFTCVMIVRKDALYSVASSSDWLVFRVVKHT